MSQPMPPAPGWQPQIPMAPPEPQIPPAPPVPQVPIAPPAPQVPMPQQAAPADPAGYVTAPVAAVQPGPEPAVPLLTLDYVSAGYGQFRALFDVSFAVPMGCAVALLGPNGAGKTTVARVCSGLVQPTNGAIYLGHQEITGMPAHELRRLGIAHAPEGRSVFASLTVEENLLLEFRSSLGKTGAPAALERAYSWFPRLRERRNQIAGTLSGGEQRMLSLARVLADLPRLLIVDELSLGLAPIIVDEVFETLDTIRSQGCTLVVIEQHVNKALELADRVVILQKGRVVYDGPTDELGDLVGQLIPGL